MANQIPIEPVNNKFREAIVALLESEKLPVHDLSPELDNFFIATDNGHVVGAIGLEIYKDDGLLRSLVVKKDYRKMKTGARLINELENFGRRSGLKNIYLLTESAEDYFKKKGYLKINRRNVPDSIKASSEWSLVCPDTAVLMQKTL